MIIHKLESDYLEKYVYRGEGNANLVISLPPKRSVLRFRKINTANATRSNDGKTRVKYEWTFFSEFISKYMGTFVMQPELMQCHPRDFENWQERVEACRPEHRKQKNSYEDLAMKLPDYTQLPECLDADTAKSTFCIEIKPKQGFVPQSDRHVQCCPYCINQYYKMEKRTIEERSTYCPCDLFSGDKIRAERAIKSLIKSPQNNFILFENGSVTWREGHNRDDLNGILRRLFEWEVSGDNQVLENLLCQLIIEGLFRAFPIGESNEQFRNSLVKDLEIDRKEQENYSMTDTIQEAIGRIKNVEKETMGEMRILMEGVEMDFFLFEESVGKLRKFESCDFSSFDLPKGSVLECLLSMQKLHFSSTSYVYQLFTKYSSLLNEETVYFPDNSEYNKKNSDSINLTDIQILRNYLLFSTARDCSILIAFRKINKQRASEIPREHVITLPKDNQMFAFNIGLTDLDPKPLDCIKKHYQRIMNGLSAIGSNYNNVNNCTEEK